MTEPLAEGIVQNGTVKTVTPFEITPNAKTAGIPVVGGQPKPADLAVGQRVIFTMVERQAWYLGRAY